MAWQLILLCVLLGIFLLLQVRVGAKICYRDDIIRVDLTVIKWSFTLYPVKEKARKKKKSRKKQVDTPKKSKVKKKRSANEILDLVQMFVPILVRTMKRVVGAILIAPMKIHWTVGSSDPATTAMTYGLAQSTLTACLPLLEHSFTIETRDIFIDLDFDNDRSHFDILVGLSMTIGQGIALSFSFIYEIVITYMVKNKLKKKKETV